MNIDRIIVQDLVSRRYMSGDSSWVEDCQQARVFDHTYQALLAALKCCNTPSQIVWCFRNPSQNMYIAVRPDDSDRVCPCRNCALAGRS